MHLQVRTHYIYTSTGLAESMEGIAFDIVERDFIRQHYYIYENQLSCFFFTISDLATNICFCWKLCFS